MNKQERVLTFGLGLAYFLASVFFFALLVVQWNHDWLVVTVSLVIATFGAWVASRLWLFLLAL